MKGSESLIESLKTDNSSADTNIIHKYNARLFTYFRSRIKGLDSYDDLVQEVFVSFFAAVKKGKIKDDEFIATFIFGIARNIVYKYFYKKKKAENIAKKAESEHDPFINFSGEEILQNERLIVLINKFVCFYCLLVISPARRVSVAVRTSSIRACHKLRCGRSAVSRRRLKMAAGPGSMISGPGNSSRSSLRSG